MLFVLKVSEINNQYFILPEDRTLVVNGIFHLHILISCVHVDVQKDKNH